MNDTHQAERQAGWERVLPDWRVEVWSTRRLADALDHQGDIWHWMLDEWSYQNNTSEEWDRIPFILVGGSVKCPFRSALDFTQSKSEERVKYMVLLHFGGVYLDWNVRAAPGLDSLVNTMVGGIKRIDVGAQVDAESTGGGAMLAVDAFHP
eukprot:1766433-Amphidinium_carterae.2